MFIVDFDDCLFDTHLFKCARLRALGAVGVDEDLYWQTYRVARNNPQGIFSYSDDRHASALAGYGFPHEKTLPTLRAVTERLPDFLFPDALEFLAALKNYQEPMILLSLGDPDFQHLKVSAGGVDKFFDRLFMVDDTKKNVLGEIVAGIGDKDIWFFIDKVNETLELTSLYPRLKAVLKKSGSIDEKEYQKSGLPYFHTLTEIKNYVAGRLK